MTRGDVLPSDHVVARNRVHSPYQAAALARILRARINLQRETLRCGLHSSIRRYFAVKLHAPTTLSFSREVHWHKPGRGTKPAPFTRSLSTYLVSAELGGLRSSISFLMNGNKAAAVSASIERPDSDRMTQRPACACPAHEQPPIESRLALYRRIYFFPRPPLKAWKRERSGNIVFNTSPEALNKLQHALHGCMLQDVYGSADRVWRCHGKVSATAI